ncbi:MAG: hypothetical protein K0Q75_2610, partial [Anaerospora sp.]|nr:hypothetical protein [Anaerospora sp.]
DLYFSFSNTVRDALDKLISDQELYKNQMPIHEQLLAAIERQDEQAAVYWAAQNLDKTMADLQVLLGKTY